MAELPLPLRSVSLSQPGFQKIYRRLQENPAEAKVVAKEIEKDPMGALERVFRLTALQRARYGGIGNDELRKRVRLLIDELESGSLRPVRLKTGRSRRRPDDEIIFICGSCLELDLENVPIPGSGER